jgi:RNA polymerase sigma-70 factor, ECF subfamily
MQNAHDILNRCKNGDTSAFRMLMEEYQGYAFALAFRIVCNEEDAKDIVQEAFIRVWKNIGRYDPAVKFTTWLYSIVTNLCFDAMRARKRMPAAASKAGLEDVVLASTALDDDPEKLFATHELASVIAALTETLPPTQRIVFVLRDLQQLSVREVCDILGLSEGSVKTNLVYARRCIRQRLERDYSPRGEM